MLDENESQDGIIAGVFFSDEMLHLSVARAHPSTHYPNSEFDFADLPDITITSPEDRKRAKSEHTKELSAEERISLAAKRIVADTHSLGGPDKLRVVTTATMGPFIVPSQLMDQDSSTFDAIKGEDRRHGEIIHGLKGERGKKWGGTDVPRLLKRFLQEHGCGDVEVRCLYKSEAFLYGEHYWYRNRTDVGRKNKGKDTVVFVLVDSGVGAAVLQDLNTLRGETRFEIGHMPIMVHVKDGDLDSCGAHQLPCLQANISLPAIQHRWGLSTEQLIQLPADDNRLDALACYLAQAASTITLMYAPAAIVFGGRVMDHDDLIPQIRAWYRQLMFNDAGDSSFPGYKAQDNLKELIKRWTFRDTGVLGCLCYSHMVATKQRD